MTVTTSNFQPQYTYDSDFRYRSVESIEADKARRSESLHRFNACLDLPARAAAMREKLDAIHHRSPAPLVLVLVILDSDKNLEIGEPEQARKTAHFRTPECIHRQRAGLVQHWAALRQDRADRQLANWRQTRSYGTRAAPFGSVPKKPFPLS